MNPIGPQLSSPAPDWKSLPQEQGALSLGENWAEMVDAIGP